MTVQDIQFLEQPCQRNHFKVLTSNICFGDEDSTPERWGADRYAVFRDIFELFNSNCSKHIIPDDFLSLDETLYPICVLILHSNNSTQASQQSMDYCSNPSTRQGTPPALSQPPMQENPRVYQANFIFLVLMISSLTWSQD